MANIEFIWRGFETGRKTSLSENAYNLGNQTEYNNPFTGLQLHRNSFFPSSINLWNNLTP
jgi:hypothetical protein